MQQSITESRCVYAKAHIQAIGDEIQHFQKLFDLQSLEHPGAIQRFEDSFLQ